MKTIILFSGGIKFTVTYDEEVLRRAHEIVSGRDFFKICLECARVESDEYDWPNFYDLCITSVQACLEDWNAGSRHCFPLSEFGL